MTREQAARHLSAVREPPDPVKELEKLAAELDGFGTKAAMGSRHPYLQVTNPSAAQLTEKIFCVHGGFWWSWGDRIAPVTEVAEAAKAVRRVLATRDEAGR